MSIEKTALHVNKTGVLFLTNEADREFHKYFCSTPV